LPVLHLQRPVDPDETRKVTRIFRHDIEQVETSICIEYKSTGADADALDNALQESDFQALVTLLQSEQAVERFKEPKHPWAEDPGTIGSLAAMFLAHVSSMAPEEEAANIKLEIHAAGAICPLVGFLRSSYEDRMQHSVIALKHLTEDCPQNAHAAYLEGALEPLIEQLGSSFAGLRGAAASTLKNICVESQEHCEEFMRLGGLKGFVNLLDLVSDPLMDHADLMLEAVWNLDEVTKDQTGRTIEQYAKLANEQGALEKLEKVRGIDDDEVSGAAATVLAALSQVK